MWGTDSSCFFVGGHIGVQNPTSMVRVMAALLKHVRDKALSAVRDMVLYNETTLDLVLFLEQLIIRDRQKMLLYILVLPFLITTTASLVCLPF